MRKEELVRALLRAARSKSIQEKKLALPVRRGTSAKAMGARSKSLRATPIPKVKDARLLRRLEQAKARLGSSKNLSGNGKMPVATKDRLILLVRGPYWLHAYWELSPSAVERASAAMGEHWHSARPVLRLHKVSGGGAGASERVVRDIEIHGGVRNWYIDVPNPPQTFRTEIGYLAANGRFHSLARSNVVSTPVPDSSDALDSHWTDVAENCDKIYAMSGGYAIENTSTELQELFEERLRRPMGSPLATRFGDGAEGLLNKERSFQFELDAEMIVYGATRPDAYVTLQGEPVRLSADGSFTVRCDLPNRRQVIPVVARTRDGVEQRTIVLAVERNTKSMEPVTREGSTEHG
jgi:hypothetical protein